MLSRSLVVRRLIILLYMIPLMVFVVGFVFLSVDMNKSSAAGGRVQYFTRRNALWMNQMSGVVNGSSDEDQPAVLESARLHDHDHEHEQAPASPGSPPSPSCETVHVAIPVNKTTDIILLLKSLLLHRRSTPLHLHFLVANDFVKGVTEKFLNSWRLPEVKLSFYSLTKNKKSNLFYNIFGGMGKVVENSLIEFSSLAKLFVASILPDDLEKVIFLDTELIVTGNIKELWTQFVSSKHNYLLGIHNSDVFCKARPSAVVFNLNLMRSSKWDETWKSAMLSAATATDFEEKENSAVKPSAVLCNMIANDDFKYVKSICSWNIDMSNSMNNCQDLTTDDYNAFYWYTDTDLVNIEAVKRNKISEHQKYFKKMKELISNYDGSLLTYIPITCKNESRKTTTLTAGSDEEEMLIKALEKGQEELMCKLLKKQSKQVFRTLMYYHGESYQPLDNYETTLVTQLSLDRLRTFSILVKQWDGPISISMYGTDADAWKFVDFISKFSVLAGRKNVNVHIIFKQGEFYPVNYLRNIALSAVRTPYVFLNDGDFIPMKGLFSYLKRATKSLIDSSKQPTVLVVPAFETTKFTLKFPKSKQELLQQIRQKLVSQFCVTCAHKTHAPTNYRAWFRARNPYQIEWAFHFEPYVVVKSNVARYDQRFMGYGFNKVSHLTLLKAQGYRFVVIPDGFIIHTPHPPTIDKKIWEHKSFKSCINSIWEGYLDEIRSKYGKECLKEKKANPVFMRSIIL